MNENRVTIADLAGDYADRRDEESLQRLRRVVLRDPGHDPGLDLLAETAAARARADQRDVLASVTRHMPGAFFSPTAHLLLSGAHEALGEVERAARERRTARLALDSILGTGDGSLERPWSVLRVSDEYDVLRARRRTSRRQTQVNRQGRALDHHRLDDDSEAWFDISPFFGERVFGERG